MDKKPMRDVFISYSRRDGALIRELQISLKQNGLEAWIDWNDIPPSSEFLKEIFTAIEASSTFCFFISQDSILSEVCRDEINHAVKYNKRIIPVLISNVDTNEVPKSIQKINWIDYHQYKNFQSFVKELISAINTDLDWTHAHTLLTIRSREWEKSGEDESKLLYGNDLKNAEQWLAHGPEKEPKPNLIQTQFIFQSRKNENRRQRIRLISIAFGFFIAIVLSLIAFNQYLKSEEQRKEAEIQTINANRKRDISIAQNLMREAVRQQKQGKQDELGALLARQAYIFNQRNNGFLLTQLDEVFREVF